MEYTTLRTALDRGVFTVTLHRPERMNAFTIPMQHELLDVFDRVNRDDDIRVVIMTGEGKAFCAGMDLEAGAATFDGRAKMKIEDHRDEGGTVALAIYESAKPVIAAINGAAVGVGITMTLPMDIRIASESAKFGFVFARRGITAEACSSWFLPRLVGISQAMEWMATGRVFDAKEALAGGLVSRVVPADKVLETANAIAREIADNTSAVAVAISRQLLWRMMAAPHPRDAHRIDSMAIFAMGGSPDAAEGVTSFLEKRPPKFAMKVSTDMPSFYPWWDKT